MKSVAFEMIIKLIVDCVTEKMTVYYSVVAVNVGFTCTVITSCLRRRLNVLQTMDITVCYVDLSPGVRDHYH